MDFIRSDFLQDPYFKDVQNIVGWSFQTQVDTIKLWLPDYFKLFNRAQVHGVLDKLKIVW